MIGIDQGGYYEFTLAAGGTLKVAKYGDLGVSFDDENGEGVVAVSLVTPVAGFTVTGTVRDIGIASVVPAGWDFDFDMTESEVSVTAPGVGLARVLVVATGADGASASYWVTFVASGDGTAASPVAVYDEVSLAAGDYDLTGRYRVVSDFTVSPGWGGVESVSYTQLVVRTS